MPRETWSDARVDLLTRLWRDGLSAAEIAAQLGAVTRNAVLGKVHRLGLSGARPPSTAAAKPARPPRTPRMPRPPRPPRPPLRRQPALPPAPPREEGRGAITDLLALGPHMCRWPIGDPKTADFSFCGAGCLGPYCVRHRKRAYVTRRARRAQMGSAA